MQKLNLTNGWSSVKIILILLFTLQINSICFSQQATLTGRVTDSQTGDPVPYVNIVIKNSLNGTTTDTLGIYQMKYPNSTDTLIFSAIGYYPVEKVIPRTILSSLSVQLKPETIDISEIEVVPDDHPMRNLVITSYSIHYTKLYEIHP